MKIRLLTASRARHNEPSRRSQWFRRSVALLSLIGVPMLVPKGYGANYYWDGGTTNSTNTPDGASEGGAGTWSTGIANWDTGAAEVVWATGNTAFFGGGGGGVNLGSTISAAGVEFTSGGYTITSTSTNTLTLTSTSSGTGSAIYTNGSGITNAFAGPIAFTAASGTTSTITTGGTTDVLNLSGAITQSSATNDSLTFAGSGTVNDTGTISSGAVGKFNVSGGTFNVGTGGSLTLTQQTYVGVNGTGTAPLFKVSGGTVSAGTLILQLGSGSGNLGAFTITSGSAAFNSLNAGNTYNAQTGGTGDGSAVVTVSGGTLTVGGVSLGSAHAGTGTLNLNGGTFSTSGAFVQNAGVTGSGGSSTINFNGGGLTLTAASIIEIPAVYTLNVQAGGALVSNALADTIVAPLLVGVPGGTDGGLTKSGAGILTLSGANTYNGGTTINAGSVYLGAGTATYGTGAVAVSSGAFAGSSTTAALTIGNNISGAGGFTQAGTNTTTLTGTNTYSGTTAINAGILEPTSIASLPGYATSGAITVASGGTLALPVGGTSQFTSANVDSVLANATFASGSALGLDTTGGSFTYASNVAGTGLGVTKLGVNTLTLSGTNSYTGTTTLAAGILNVGNASALGTGTLLFSGGTLQYGSGVTTDFSNRTSTAANQSFNIDTNGNNVTFASPLAPTSGGTLTKLGAGTLALTGASTYTGTTTISAGTLQLGNATTTGTIGAGAIVDNATLALDHSAAFTVANNISGTGTVMQIGAGAATLTGVLNQGGGLTIGTGGATISGANTYGGATTVNGFVDLRTSNTVLGATGVGNGTTINTGGTLRFRDTTFSNVAEAITINGGSFFTYNDAGTSTFSGQFTLDSSSVIQTSPQSQVGTTTVFSGGFVEGGTASNLTFVRDGTAGTASNDVVSLTAASTYGGNTFITDALTTNTGSYSVKLSGVNNVLPTTTIVTLGGANGGGAATGNGRLIIGDPTTGAISQTLAGLTTSGTGTGNAVVGGSAAVSTLTINNSASDTYSGLLGGAGTNNNNLALVAGGSSTLILSGANTYTGGTSINGGVLSVGNASALGTTGTISFGGGTLQYGAGITTDYSSRFSTAANQVYSVDTNGQNVTYATGLASGGGTLAVTDSAGTGSLSLTGASTYGGATTINSGTLNLARSGASGAATGGTLASATININSPGALLLSASNALGSGAAVNLSGGTFQTSGASQGTAASTQNGTMSGNVTSGGSVTSANATSVIGLGALTLTGTSTLNYKSMTATLVFTSLNGSGTLDVINYTNNTAASTGNVNSGVDGTDDRLVFSQALTGTQLADINFNGTSASEIELDGTFYEVVPSMAAVPEPATWLAGFLTFGSAGFSQRRRLRGLFARGLRAV